LEERQHASAGAALVAKALRAIGFGDGRAFSLVALVLALALAARLAAGAEGALAWALAALLPPAALGVAFGSDAALWLAAALFVLGSASRVSLGASRAAAALIGFAALLDASLLAGSAHRFAGVGLVNLAAYVGLESSHGLQLALALGSVAVGASAVWSWRRAGSSAEAFAGVALTLLLALFFAPAASPFRLALPLALLGLAALVDRRGGATSERASVYDGHDA